MQGVTSANMILSSSLINNHSSSTVQEDKIATEESKTGIKTRVKLQEMETIFIKEEHYGIASLMPHATAHQSTDVIELLTTISAINAELRAVYIANYLAILKELIDKTQTSIKLINNLRFSKIDDYIKSIEDVLIVLKQLLVNLLINNSELEDVRKKCKYVCDKLSSVIYKEESLGAQNESTMQQLNNEQLGIDGIATILGQLNQCAITTNLQLISNANVYVRYDGDIDAKDATILKSLVADARTLFEKINDSYVFGRKNDNKSVKDALDALNQLPENPSDSSELKNLQNKCLLAQNQLSNTILELQEQQLQQELKQIDESNRKLETPFNRAKNLTVENLKQWSIDAKALIESMERFCKEGHKCMELLKSALENIESGRYDQKTAYEKCVALLQSISQKIKKIKSKPMQGIGAEELKELSKTDFKDQNIDEEDLKQWSLKARVQVESTLIKHAEFKGYC